MGSRIVVWDPSAKLAEGTFVEGDHQFALLKTKGIVTLPTDVDLFGRNAVAGYFRRGWGVGWPFADQAAAQRGCPMLLFVATERPYIHWVARLVPYGEKERAGRLRLTTNTSQIGASAGGVSPEIQAPDLAELGPPDAHSGWTIGGRSRVSTIGEGYFGLSLYGNMRGLAVVWSAVSQSRHPE